MSVLEGRVLLLKSIFHRWTLFRRPLNDKLVCAGYFKAQYFTHKPMAKDTSWTESFQIYR